MICYISDYNHNTDRVLHGIDIRDVPSMLNHNTILFFKYIGDFTINCALD